MDYKEKEELSANKKIYLFKWFIKFLEIYGQETFGESASVNWGLVYNEIIGHSVWSMNIELDNLLYNEQESLDSEEFRDKVFSYIEDQVLRGYPIFRLFYLPEKLKKYYEDELKQEIYENDKKRFNKYKCYRCKHYCYKINVYVGDPGMNIIRIDEEYSIGFRPRDVEFVEENENEENAIFVETTILSFENHGSEFLYLVDFKGTTAFVKELSKNSRKVNTKINFIIKKENIYVFDSCDNRVYDQNEIEVAYDRFKACWKEI